MAISGRYETTGPVRTGTEVLHLRVDVDDTVAHAMVCHVISGDVFLAAGAELDEPTHQFSWRVTVPPPAVLPRTLPFAFTGPARVLRAQGESATVAVEIVEERLAGSAPELRATVTIVRDGDDRERRFSCTRTDLGFRKLDVYLDTVVGFRRPEFRVGDPNLIAPDPAVPRRSLDLSRALAEAGVTATVNEPQHPLHDTFSSGQGKETWADAELDAAMKAQLTELGLSEATKWPRWFVWGALVGRHDNRDHMGVMFDSDKAPFRQGCAVFREHPRFASLLPAGDPTTAPEAAAQRMYLFTWMHEIGHCFRLKHSDDTGRPGALSWMNIDDARNSAGSFWKDFPFAFDRDDLVHLRHGHWRDVIMGGLRFGAGSEPTASDSPADVPQSPKLELRVRSRGYVDFMGPVKVELRLLNQQETGRPVGADLQPEGHRVRVYIRTPDGRVVEYRPLIRTCRDEPRLALAPRGCKDGRDRYSEEVDLTFGGAGFYFSEPGEYSVKAIYQTDGGGVIGSNWERLRVGYPGSKEFDRLAQDFFAPEVGRCLYLRGSQAPYLQKHGLDVLQDMARRTVGTPMGADLALSIVDGVKRSFDTVEQRTVTRIKAPDPFGALALTDAAVRLLESSTDKQVNLRHARLVRTRSACRKMIDDRSAGVAELITLHDRLQARGAHAAVLSEIRESARKLAGGQVSLPW